MASMRSHGPSMKCHQCSEIKPCRMAIDQAPQADTKGKVAPNAPLVQIIIYLCTECRRELGRV
jgi:hypothetical protein